MMEPLKGSMKRLTEHLRFYRIFPSNHCIIQLLLYLYAIFHTVQMRKRTLALYLGCIFAYLYDSHISPLCLMYFAFWSSFRLWLVSWQFHEI